MGLLTSSNLQNLAPVQTKSISANSSSQAITFDYSSPTAFSQLDGNNSISSCMVQNAGTKTAFIKFGPSGVTATANDTPVLAGAIYTFDKGTNLSAAAICSGMDTTTIYFTAGIGS